MQIGSQPQGRRGSDPPRGGTQPTTGEHSARPKAGVSTGKSGPRPPGNPRDLFQTFPVWSAARNTAILSTLETTAMVP